MSLKAQISSPTPSPNSPDIDLKQDFFLRLEHDPINIRNIFWNDTVCFSFYDVEFLGRVLGRSVSTLHISIFGKQHYESKVFNKLFASVLGKVFKYIPKLYEQFYQKVGSVRI